METKAWAEDPPTSRKVDPIDCAISNESRGDTALRRLRSMPTLGSLRGLEERVILEFSRPSRGFGYYATIVVLL